MPFKVFKLVGLALIFAWHVAVEAEDRTLLILGDSLSAGFGVDLDDTWAAMLQARLVEQGYGYRVINASISGDTTGGGLRRLPRALRIHQPEIVLIELGGNDGLRGTPINVMRDNLAAMIELSHEAGAAVVLAGMQIPTNYGKDYTGAFSRTYDDLAKEYDVALIGFFLEGVALKPELMQDDGIHPNRDAQPVLLENVWTVLEPEVLQPGAAGETSLSTAG